MNDKQRAKWLRQRRRGIGASDLGPILGLDRFRNATDIYRDKLGLSTTEDNADMARGRALEPLILAMVAKAQNQTVHPVTMLKGRSAPWMLATPDGVIGTLGTPDAVLVEAKAPRSKTYDRVKAEGPPDAWLVQVQWQMLIADAPRCILAVLNADRWELLCLPIDFDRNLATELEAAARRFWYDNVLAKVEPEDPKAFKVSIPLPEGGEATQLDLTPELVQALLDYDQATVMVREGDQLKKAAHEQVIGLLPGYGRYLCGEVRLTYSQVTSMRLDRKAAEAELGDLSRFEKPTVFSKLTIAHPREEE